MEWDMRNRTSHLREVEKMGVDEIALNDYIKDWIRQDVGKFQTRLRKNGNNKQQKKEK